MSLTELKVFEPLGDKMHGILLPSALISPHKSNKYHEYLSLRDFFLPQITQIIKIFFFFWFACFRRCLKLCSTDYTDFLSLRDVLFLSRNARNSIAFSSRAVGSRKILFIFCLFPTDNTDFFALLKILATLGNLSKLNCPRLSQDFSDFCHFFTFGSKTVGSGFNNSSLRSRFCFA